jgi:hypothetical protein
LLPSGDDVPASISLNKPRTVPNGAVGLGTARANGSRKVPDEGPPDKKRRPGAGGTAAGSKSKTSSTKIEQRKNSKARRSDQEKLVRRHLTVTSGTITIGFIDGEGSQFTATAVDGAPLGVFDSIKDAACAVSEAEAFDGAAP